MLSVCDSMLLSSKRACSGDHKFFMGACQESTSTDVAGSRLTGRWLKLSSPSGLPASEDAAAWEATITGLAKHAQESSRSLLGDSVRLKSAPGA